MALSVLVPSKEKSRHAQVKPSWRIQWKQVLLMALCLSIAVLIDNDVAHAQKATPRTSTKPNVIFVLVDDLGYGDVGFNGQQKVHTPNIDRLAAEGMIFRNAYSGSTVCGPSRISLMLGKHTGHSPVRGNPGWIVEKNNGLSASDVTVAEELKRAGYATAVVGKWGFGQKNAGDLPLSQGFDYFYGFADHGKAHHYYPSTIWENDKELDIPENTPFGARGLYIHDAFTAKAKEFITHHRQQPFFLYLTWTTPHLELTVPEESKKPYQNLGWPEHEMKKVPGGYQNDAEGNTAYAGMISRMDRDMGSILDLLKELKIDENTLIVFSSDNGPEYAERSGNFFQSNGPFKGFKRDLYEGGIHVPFAVRWPARIKAGSSSDHILAFWDFLPTACEIAGIKPKDGALDGISFLPALLSNMNRQASHEYLYWEFNENQGPVQALRKGKWKAVKFYEQPVELYDLSSDMGEKKNVAEQHPDIIANMQQLLATARTDNPSYPLIPLKNSKGRTKNAKTKNESGEE